MNMKRKVFHILCAVALILAQMVPAFAQADAATATLKGTITDPNNAVVVGAAVTVKSLEKGITRTDKTGSSGTFQIPLLQPGAYELRVEATGFETKVVSQIELTV